MIKLLWQKLAYWALPVYYNRYIVSGLLACTIKISPHTHFVMMVELRIKGSRAPTESLYIRVTG
ncbi:hypothetical protein GS393_03566 [Pseudomonas savastanoi pv. phaseolicola]|nr:hypothetical protein [Pseudomonas savastanoi pv. phaseolicola]